MYTVDIQGAATLHRCNELHSQLQDALERNTEIEVSLDQVTDCDLSLFQLLWATKRSCDTRGLSVTVRLPLPETVEKRAVALGWFRSEEAIPRAAGEDLWNATWGVD